MEGWSIPPGQVGTDSRLRSTANDSISTGSFGSTCLFTCAVTTLGNNGTIKANVLVSDTYGNTINSIGSGRAVKIAANGGTISGTPLAITSTGPAETATQFTYTARQAAASPTRSPPRPRKAPPTRAPP